VEKVLSQVVEGKKLSYYDVFQNFKVSLSDLIDIAVQIQPDCLTVRKNTRKKEKVIPRQMLCYFASQMGYSDVQVSKEILVNRVTVIYSKNVVEDALSYNNLEYRKVYREFIKHLKTFPNGDYLEHLD
jgi:hypothetical protein